MEARLRSGGGGQGKAELTLRERIARRLCELYGTLPPDDEDHIRCGGKPAWTGHDANAGELLKTIREPTEAMLDAAWNSGWLASCTESEDFTRWWRAMIDAELPDQ
jgi:hypothetical protein